MADATAPTAGAAPESSFSFVVEGSETFTAELVAKSVAKPSSDGSDKLLVAPDSLRKLVVLTSLRLSSEPSVALRFFELPSEGVEELQGAAKKLIRLETAEEGSDLVLRQRVEEPASKAAEEAAAEEEKKAAPAKEEGAVPAPEEEEAAPAKKEEGAVPAPEEEEAAPVEEEKEAAPAPEEEEAAPVEEEKEAAPAPEEEEAAPVEEEKEAAPAEEETAPATEEVVSPTEKELNEIIEREDETEAPVPIPEDIEERIVETLDESLPSATDATVTTIAPEESLGDAESLDAVAESAEETAEDAEPSEVAKPDEPAEPTEPAESAALGAKENGAEEEKEEAAAAAPATEAESEDNKPWSGIQSAIKRQVRWLDSIGKGIASFAPPADGEPSEDVPAVVAWGQRNARVISAGACAILVAVAVATLGGGSRKRRS